MTSRRRAPRSITGRSSLDGPRLAGAVGLICLAFGLSVGAARGIAQEGGAADATSPLQKSDVIRLLTGSTYSQDEIAGIISRSCLTFTPTPRDLDDFQALGADEAITAAIRTCMQGGGTLELVAEQTIAAPAGGEGTVEVRVMRDGRPRPGARVELSGMQTVPGGTDDVVSALTDADGRAALTVQGGTRQGTYRLFLVVTDGADRQSTPIFLTTTAGLPARAEMSPTVLAMAETPVGDLGLTVMLLDAFDSPVPNADVALRPALASMPMGELRSTTNQLGQARFAIPSSGLRAGDTLTVFAADVELGRIAVEVREPSDVNSGFVSGLDQQGAAGTELAEPLIFEVRGEDGRPVEGQSVSFLVTNGFIVPANGATDADGRIAAVVTLGADGAPTRVTAQAGAVVRAAVFEPQPAVTALGAEAQVEEARALTARGDYAAAAILYRSVLEDNPNHVDALVGLGGAEAMLGQYDAATESYRAALRVDPGRVDAQAGIGAVLLAEGRPAEAIPWLEFATRGDPDDSDKWVALGAAYAGDSQTVQAQAAFERALQIDPSDREAQRWLASLGPVQPALEFAAWGGNTFDNGRDFGPRMFQIAGRPLPVLRLWFRFDNALNLDIPLFAPLFVRGPDDIEAFYGGVALDWGARQRLKTSFQLGRRDHPPAPGTTETVWQLEQGVKFPAGNGNNILLSFGGLLGHYFDRDDWMAYARVGVPIARSWLIEPGLYVGDTGGSNIVATGRQPEQEIRGILWVRYRPASGWIVDPSIAYGSVDSEMPQFSGSLIEGQLRLGAPIGKASLIELFVRYQNPPGSDPFTTLALGFNLGIPRSVF